MRGWVVFLGVVALVGSLAAGSGGADLLGVLVGGGLIVLGVALPTKTWCRACRKDMLAKDRHCGHCGAANPLVCRACGTRLQKDARYCSGCGADSSAAPPEGDPSW